MPIELYVILMICSKAEVYKFPNISYNISLPKNRIRCGIHNRLVDYGKFEKW